MPRTLPASLSALLLFSAAHAHATEPHALSVDAGYGRHLRVAGVGWKMPLEIAMLADRPRLSAGLLVRLARWEARADFGRQRLWDASATSYLAHAMGRHWGADVFLEAGLGVHLLSESTLGPRRLGSAFQFGEFLGATARFGEDDAYQLSLRIEHVSNGGLQPPNDGMTYTSLSLARRF